MVSLRRTRRPPAALLHNALRVCLVVSLWPTPVPWVHCHEHAGSGGRLAFHLNEYHTQEVAGSHDGWHLHFAYLWRLAEDPDCPEDRDEPPPSQQPATPAASPPLVADLAAPAAQPCWAVALEFPPSAQPTTQEAARHNICPGGFLNSYAGVIAPHQLLGVLLC